MQQSHPDAPTTSPTLHVDLLVIGTGSGNSILDERFDSWSVAIVERDVFGGTCLNRGCIPSKMLVYPADVVATLDDARGLGVHGRVDDVDWSAMQRRIFGRLDEIAANGEAYRRSQDNVTVVSGSARFVGERTVEVVDATSGTTRIVAERVVLAAGGRPRMPDIDGLASVPHHTSDTIMRVERVPRSMLIVGGGFIAVEQAHIFSAFGSDVTVAARSGVLISHHDRRIAERFTSLFSRRVDVHLHTTVRRVATLDDNTIRAELVDADGRSVDVDVETLLVATGRQPNSDDLEVALGGVGCDENGYVNVAADLSTSAERVWALGDICRPIGLKHVANLDAEIVRENLLIDAAGVGTPLTVPHRHVPHAVFSHPQVGSVGLGVEDALAEGYSVRVGWRDYSGVAYGWALGDDESACCVVVDDTTDKILGVHAVGYQASLVIQPGVTAMQFGITASQLATGVMYPHPALSEVLENALLDAASEPVRHPQAVT